jgi:aminopeptidase N
MIRRNIGNWQRDLVVGAIFCAMWVLSGAGLVRADEPYARSKDYDLQHSKIALRFQPEQKKVMGDVTHSLTLLRDGLEKISFDSVGLQIESVHINKSAAKFAATENKLVVTLPKGASGAKYDDQISGHASKGLYFVLPDKDYPNRPLEIWSQESRTRATCRPMTIKRSPDDRDDPDRPTSWITISNGKLISVTDASRA